MKDIHLEIEAKYRRGLLKANPKRRLIFPPKVREGSWVWVLTGCAIPSLNEEVVQEALLGLHPPRGLPTGLSKEVQEKIDSWNQVEYCFTWYSLREVLTEVNWALLCPNNPFIIFCAEKMSLYGTLDDVRFILWHKSEH